MPTHDSPPPTPSPSESLPSSEQLGAELTALQATADQFYAANKEAQDQTLSPSDRAAATALANRLLAELQERKERLDMKLNPFEKQLGLKAQYEQQKAILSATGLLITIPTGEHAGRQGIIDHQGNHHPIPSFAEISKLMIEDRASLKTKLEQGFVRLQLTPLAIPVARLIATYSRLLLEHHHAGKLFAADDDPTQPGERLDLNVDDPCHDWNSWAQKDIDGSLLYYPTDFVKPPGKPTGLTKAQLITALPVHGWKIELLEATSIIPRAGQGTTLGARPQLEAGKAPTDYLTLLLTDPRYQHEQGQTIESSLTQAIFRLESHNQVMDNYQGKGSLNFLIGNWHPSSGVLPNFYWDRVYQRAGVVGVAPGVAVDFYGVRSAVGVGKVGV